MCWILFESSFLTFIIILHFFGLSFISSNVILCTQTTLRHTLHEEQADVLPSWYLTPRNLIFRHLGETCRLSCLGGLRNLTLKPSISVGLPGGIPETRCLVVAVCENSESNLVVLLPYSETVYLCRTTSCQSRRLVYFSGYPWEFRISSGSSVILLWYRVSLLE